GSSCTRRSATSAHGKYAAPAVCQRNALPANENIAGQLAYRRPAHHAASALPVSDSTSARMPEAAMTSATIGSSPANNTRPRSGSHHQNGPAPTRKKGGG